jgi:hypothetical protein
MNGHTYVCIIVVASQVNIGGMWTLADDEGNNFVCFIVPVEIRATVM